MIHQNRSGSGMLLLGAAAIATLMTGAAYGAANSDIETITVTGSRVITDSANSPTPLTVISNDQLQQTTPTNIADGLNKLPIFQGSVGINRAGDGTGGYGVAGVR